MPNILASRMARLRGESAFEVLAQARELEAAGRSIVHLETGDPDFDALSQRGSLREAGVALLSGGGFGTEGKGCVRLSYANSIENIDEAVRRLAAWLTEM